MAKNKKLILAHSSMSSVSLDGTISVMLTPQFYTIKRENLPIKYAYQVKKIAPAIFDGLLENGREYSYLVWKEDDSWMLLAYDLKMIIEFLKSKGFFIENISKLFFAQQMMDLFDKPLPLGNREALVSINGDMVVVPSSALGDGSRLPLVFDDRFTPKSGVSIDSGYGSLLSTKHSIFLSSISMIFAIIYFVEGSRYSTVDDAKKRLNELLESNPSLASSYSRDSIIEKYTTIDKDQRAKRDVIKALSSMIFTGVTLEYMNMKETSFEAKLICKNKKASKSVKDLASKNGLKSRDIKGSSDVMIEGSL